MESFQIGVSVKFYSIYFIKIIFETERHYLLDVNWEHVYSVWVQRLSSETLYLYIMAKNLDTVSLTVRNHLLPFYNAARIIISS